MKKEVEMPGFKAFLRVLLLLVNLAALPAAQACALPPEGDGPVAAVAAAEDGAQVVLPPQARPAPQRYANLEVSH